MAPFLLSDCNDYDTEDIIISIDDISAMSSSSSSSTLGEGTRSNNNDHNQENPIPMMNQQSVSENLWCNLALEHRLLFCFITCIFYAVYLVK
jgi:hypothetical protein